MATGEENSVGDINAEETPKTSSLKGEDVAEVSDLPTTSNSIADTAVKKKIGIKKAGKSGGLGARKITTKVFVFHG